jgi:hypothetical protein
VINQPPGVPDDGTADDCIAADPTAAQTLAMAEYAEHGTATKTAGEHIGDLVQMPDA